MTLIGTGNEHSRMLSHDGVAPALAGVVALLLIWTRPMFCGRRGRCWDSGSPARGSPGGSASPRGKASPH